MLPRNDSDRIQIILDDHCLVANTGLILPVPLAQAWTAGAGPGDDPLTIDLDSTVCETFGLAKGGAQRHNYAGWKNRLRRMLVLDKLESLVGHMPDVAVKAPRKSGPAASGSTWLSTSTGTRHSPEGTFASRARSDGSPSYWLLNECTSSYGHRAVHIPESLA